MPVWGAPTAGLLLLALVWMMFIPATQGAQALKIGYFYLLLPIILLRTPLTVRDRDRLVTILMVLGELTALYGIAQQFLGPDRLASIGYEYNESIRSAGGFLRSFSTFNQPFGFGLFLTMVLLVGGSVALAHPRRWRNAFFLLCSPLLILGMSLSIVRGAYLGLAVGVALLAIARYRGLLLLVPAGVALLMNLPPDVLRAVFSSSSLGERSSGWSDVADEILRHPFGIGLGSTGSVAEKVAALSGSRLTTYQPDSQYVKMLLELGIIGVWLFTLLLIAAVAAALVTARSASDPDSALALGIAASIVAAVAASAVATYFEIFPMDFYFWTFLGVLACIPLSGSMASLSDPAAAGFRHTSGNCSPPSLVGTPSV